jgi:hypothetical protein
VPRKLFAILLIAALPLAANEISYRSLQSGWLSNATPLYDHGLHGEGQIIAILDTGLDVDSCWFAEPDGSRPPINSVDLTRRKVVAYDFLYDDPNAPNAYDNQGHGTHAAGAAAGDQLTPLVHDYADALATGAKLIVQDAGFTGGDACSQRPGIGCPVNLTPILDQAYRQGARIHSNSWGDRQGVAIGNPPTGNYSASARDVDAFVFAHPDFLVVFNTGNLGTLGTPPPSSLSAPGCAKNTLQVGGTRNTSFDSDDTLDSFSLAGPTRDGRIKPDLVGPAYVTAADAKVITGGTCGATAQPGTSWAAPTIAGAAALVRQYFTFGYYPTGIATPSNAFAPSAALLKATLIAAARRVPWRGDGSPSAPVPSPEQGFGFPVLGDALYFPGNHARLRIADVPLGSGLAEGSSATLTLEVKSGTPLKVVLVWTDPAGVPRGASDPTPELVNDLDLRVADPSGAVTFGNDSLHPGQPDRRNNVEVVALPAPTAGTYSITVTANHLGSGARQGYALVVTGDAGEPSPRAARTRAVRH